MNNKIEHAKKVLACIDKIKEGLSELVALLDNADDAFGEMDRLANLQIHQPHLG